MLLCACQRASLIFFCAFFHVVDAASNAREQEQRLSEANELTKTGSERGAAEAQHTNSRQHLLQLVHLE